MKNILFPCIAFSMGVLLFTSCEKRCSNTISETFVASNFHTVSAGDNHRITLRYSPAYSVKATGCEEDINDLKVYVINGVLSISYDSEIENRDQIQFTIAVPAFTTIELEDDAACTINGFTDTTLAHNFNLSGKSSCSYTGDASLLTATLSDDADMTLAGNILQANVNLSGNARYNAKNTTNNHTTTINAGNSSLGYVYALDTLNATASGTARIYYKGDPAFKNFTETGQGKILPL